MSSIVTRPLTRSKIFTAPFLTARPTSQASSLFAVKLAKRKFSQTMAEGEKISLDTLPEHERWKYRVPYRAHEKNEYFDAKYEANCHCGAIKYQLSREAPLASKLCHCVDCQAQHCSSSPVIVPLTTIPL